MEKVTKEQILDVIKDYLSRSEGGSLIIDHSDNTIDWTPVSSAISWGSYEVIDSSPTNECCECGELFNVECEQCTDRAHYLLDKVVNEYLKV